MCDLDMAAASSYMEHKGSFDLLHGCLRYLRENQGGVGCVAVSPRYALQVRFSTFFWISGFLIGSILEGRIVGGSRFGS